jgi:hypothetical protein
MIKRIVHRGENTARLQAELLDLVEEIRKALWCRDACAATPRCAGAGIVQWRLLCILIKSPATAKLRRLLIHHTKEVTTKLHERVTTGA